MGGTISNFFQIFLFLLGFVVGNFSLYKNIIRTESFFKSEKVFQTSEDTKLKILSSDGLYDETLSEQLFHNVKILCWVFTHPDNHYLKAIHIKNLWGKRCNKLLFISTIEDPILGTVKSSVDNGRDQLWNKTIETYRYVKYEIILLKI